MSNNGEPIANEDDINTDLGAIVQHDWLLLTAAQTMNIPLEELQEVRDDWDMMYNAVNAVDIEPYIVELRDIMRIADYALEYHEDHPDQEAWLVLSPYATEVIYMLTMAYNNMEATETPVAGTSGESNGEEGAYRGPGGASTSTCNRTWERIDLDSSDSDEDNN